MKQHGITLIELLVTVSIIVLLGAFTYPAFSVLLAEHHRHQAEQTLLIMAKNMEVYKIQNQSYAGVALADIKPANLPVDDNYQYVISELTDDSYQLSAEPLAGQAKHDSECGTLTLDQLGEKKSSNSNNCWG